MKKLKFIPEKYDILEIIQNHQALYTHPDNLEWLKSKFETKESVQIGKYVASIRPIQIITDNKLSQYDYEWEETEFLPKSRFWSLIDDIQNPPSYAITWGWVRQTKKIPIVYLINNPTYTVKTWQ